MKLPRSTYGTEQVSSHFRERYPSLTNLGPWTAPSHKHDCIPESSICNRWLETVHEQEFGGWHSLKYPQLCEEGLRIPEKDSTRPNTQQWRGNFWDHGHLIGAVDCSCSKDLLPRHRPTILLRPDRLRDYCSWSPNEHEADPNQRHERTQARSESVFDTTDHQTLMKHVMGKISTERHPSGTAAMMPLEMGGVVDPELKVYGTCSLRIADASIMPLIPSAHLQASAYGIAEKVRFQ